MSSTAGNTSFDSMIDETSASMVAVTVDILSVLRIILNPTHGHRDALTDRA